MYQKILAVCCAVALIGITAGCHTMKGVGEDIQNGGQAISRAASK